MRAPSGDAGRIALDDQRDVVALPNRSLVEHAGYRRKVDHHVVSQLGGATDDGLCLGRLNFLEVLGSLRCEQGLGSEG